MRKIFKIIFASIFFALLCIQSIAQQNHFLYIQADDKQTFSVNVDGKTYNSSDIGYVIVPKLTDGKYQLNVSFPDNKYPDQQFSCVINKADEGFALKNYNEKGWGLFNLQTLNVTMAGTDVPDVPKDTTNPNAFGEMLSDVMRDTTLKQAGIELQEAEKQKQLAAENANNAPSVIVVPTLNDSLLSAQKQDSNMANKSIMKISEKKTGTGTRMVFVDVSTGDTIKVFLPKHEQAAVAEEQRVEDTTAIDSTVATNDNTLNANNNVEDSNKVTQQSVDSNAVVISPVDSNVEEGKQPESEPKNEDVKKEDVNPAPAADSDQPNNPFYKGEKKTDSTIDATPNNSAETTSSSGNSSSSSPEFKQDCKKMFADNELDKLKKKMVSSNTDDKMIQTAKKYVEDKCVTTDQVKSLGLLFLTDDGRYSFFDAMYKNVYDISAFPSLQNQLIDPYYKKRFQAMLK
jgi:hypothetical protein